MDSWEDDPEQPPPPPPPQGAGFAFNPKASTFAFNPNASSFGFVPGGQPPPPPPSVQPPPPPRASARPPAPTPAAPAPPPAPVKQPEPVAAIPKPAVVVEPVQVASVPEPAPASPSADAPSESPEADVTEKIEKLQVVEELVPVDSKSRIMEAFARLKEEDPREHLNIVFIGHVDAGKSTLSGQILYITGCVDKRTIEKYEREAKEKNREGWYMAYIMDTNEEERTKGITVEVGRAHFETVTKRYTILDAPGHKNYVPNMIQGASQADVAVLVISSRKGEFEAGAERGGQTIEHAQLAKTLGVTRLIVVINKLDDHTVCLPGGKWDKGRFDQIVTQLTPAFKACQYNVKRDITFLPIAALYGKNIKDKVPAEECDWYNGPTLFEVLDSIPAPDRNPEIPFRMPIMDRYRDMGTIVMGRSEAGLVQVGDVLQIMPNRLRVKVEALYRDEKEVTAALAGENLRLRLTGADENDVSTGFVLSSIKSPIPCVTQFEAQIMVLDLLESKSIFTVGYKSVLHLHCITEECEVTKLVAEIDKKTGAHKKSKFVKSQGACICRIQVDKPICIEAFTELAAMGRFTLRDEGKTIAIGKVTKLPKGSSTQ